MIFRIGYVSASVLMILLENSFLMRYFSIAVQKSSDPHPTRGLTIPDQYARARHGMPGHGCLAWEV